MTFQNLGIMQGRLSQPIERRIQHFPIENWEEEFQVIANLDLSSIEWVYEYNKVEKNPLHTFENLERIKKISKDTNVRISSVVADYFMESKLFNEDDSLIKENLGILKTLLMNSEYVGIPIIELPFVDNSSLKDCSDIKGFVKRLSSIVEIASDLGIKISLETDLEPRSFKSLLRMFLPLKVYANFDMGNSAANGFNPKEEIQILSEDIINVHIKDRVLGGGTVPLGEGDTDFYEVFSQLESINYSEDFILQAARQDIGRNNYKNCVSTITEYIEFLKPYIIER